jgi:hypothetical protein
MKETKGSKRYLYLLFSITIFFTLLLIFEFVLRNTHLFNAKISWAEPDPIVGWRYTPGYTYWYNKENDHPITGKINSFGWRDKEWSFKKPSNTYRIAVLGDSFVAAFQVELEKTFLAIAEQQLNEKCDIKIELMNFGQSGYTQTEEFLVLKNEVLQFSPDMVLLFFFPGNDIQDVRRETSVSSLRPYYRISPGGELILDTSFVNTRVFKIKSLINPLKQHSALISLLAERYNLYMRQRRINADVKKIAHNENETNIKRLPGYLSLCTTNPDPTYLKSYQLNKRLIRAMVDLCKAEGIRFMLVSINTPAYIPEIEKEYKSIDPTFNIYFFEDDLKEYARFLDIEYLGLQSIFRKHYETLRKKLHWGHWNYDGHRVVAAALREKLLSITDLKKDCKTQ